MLEIGNRPLLDTELDARLYVEPSNARRIEASLKQRVNVIIFGDAGVGKTTLLRQLALQLREHGTAAVFVSAEHARSAGEILAAAVTGLRDAGLRIAIGDDAGPSAVDMAQALVLSELPSMIVLVDGVRADAGHELFGRLRDLLWQMPITWVVAARTSERAILTPPADSFFEQQIALGPMAYGEIEQLLKLRLGDEAARVPVGAVAEASYGNPLQALALTRAVLIDHADVEQIFEGRVLRESAVSMLDRAPAMLFAEIEQLDRPVWSSDEELLRRMGWTRNRAVQVLGELENEGLLTSYNSRGPNGGQVKMFVVNQAWRP